MSKTGVWGCVQARAQWSTEEDVHMRPGNHWLCEFGDEGDYRVTIFYTGDRDLVIKWWLNRVEEDASGLTFQEWTPDVDTSRPPVAMLINSSELRAAGFKLKEVLPPALEAAARGGLRIRAAGMQSLEGMGPKRFVLSVDDDTEFRSRCEWIIPFFSLKCSIFPINLLGKKNRGGCLSDNLRMLSLEKLFRLLMDVPDRGISLRLRSTKGGRWSNEPTSTLILSLKRNRLRMRPVTV